MMKVMNAFTIRSLSTNKVRTIVTVIGVALASALLTAVLVSFTSLTNYMYLTEAEVNGTWMAQVDLPCDQASQDQIAEAESSADVSAYALVQDIGFAKLDEEKQMTIGRYVPLVNVEGDANKVMGINVAEGRMPEGPTEILLYSAWHDMFQFDLGDEIEFNVGLRQAVLAPGKSNEASTDEPCDGSADASVSGAGEQNGPSSSNIDEGTLLGSLYGYLDAESDGGIFNERLVDLHPLRFKVVGFYEAGNWSLSTGTGYCGVTTGYAGSKGDLAFYMSFKDPANTDAVTDMGKQLFPDASINLHTNLLRYMGVAGHGAIWTTFYGIVAILAIVILVAGISLIYNAFSISVNERMRQFGLLASIGASKKQLRQCVLFEAFLMAVIGIPVGILVGIGGCAIVFAILGPSIANMLIPSDIPFAICIKFEVIALVVVVNALTVFASAWIPAIRAGHVSPVASLRQNDQIKLSKKALRKTPSKVNLRSLWKRGGMWYRLFGVGGRIAQIDYKRNASKGRGATLSLMVAIVLLMTAGSFNTQMSTLTTVAGPQTKSDLSLSVGFANAENTSGTDAQIDARKRSEKVIGICENIYDKCLQLEGVTGEGWKITDNRPLSVSHESAGSVFDSDLMRMDVDGSYITEGYLIYLSDEAFKDYAAQNGIAWNGSDTSTIPAIGVGNGYGNDGNTYTIMQYLKGTEGIRVATGAKAHDTYYDNVSLIYGKEGLAADRASGNGRGNDGLSLYSMGPMGSNEDATLADGDSREHVAVTPDEVIYKDLDVIGLAKEAPFYSHYISNVAVVVPASAVQNLPFADAHISFGAYFNAADHAEAALEIGKIAGEAHDSSSFRSYYSNVQDYVAEEESMRMTVTVVNVFCLLFTLILTLIALANVFNTVTNGLILRRREFAVMKSIGMGNTAFRKMISAECIGYSVRGLVPGIVISLVVSVLLFRFVGVSVSGMTYTVPWEYLLLSIALVAAIMLISVGYGMHRCKADNVVEALRME